MRIAVAGATGRVGANVVDVLAEQGHEVVPMSRSAGVDIVSGAGLDDALAGVEVVIDAASTPSPDKEEATAFFTAAARNLHAAGARAGVRRLVVVSIIGIDRGFTGGYAAAKLLHERAALAGPVPTQLLRAAQFHEFVPLLMRWGRRGDVIRLPEMRTQLVAARAVAEELVRLAVTDAPIDNSPIPEVAGPRPENLADAAALVAARDGDTATIEAGRDPQDPDGALNAEGGLLPGPHATLAGPTFADWIAGSR